MPQLAFGVSGPIFGVKSLKIGPLEPNIHCINLLLAYLQNVAWDVVNSCIFGPNTPILASKLNQVPKYK